MARQLHFLRCFVPTVMALTLGACSTTDPQQAFMDVSDIVDDRTGHTVAWDTGTGHDQTVRDHVRELLQRPLTPHSATQIALLNNRELQAAYTEVGISQAALVQAGLPRNPALDGAVTWFADAGGTPNLALGVAWHFIDLFFIPMRKSVARSQLEEAKLRIAAKIIGHVSSTRTAFANYVAARQIVGLYSQVVRSTTAGATAAKSLRRAGNITALRFEQLKNQRTLAKLQMARAQAMAAEARERINILLGLTGSETEWRAPVRLPEPPAQGLDTSRSERRAIAMSLDIQLARQRLTTLGRRFNLVKRTSLIDGLEAGVEYEREVEVERSEDGSVEKTIRKAFGPAFGVEIPIFDHGQAKKAGALMRIVQAEHELYGLAVKVRSAARLARGQLLTARRMVEFYRAAILPETARILAGTQRDVNAMQEDVFRLLTAKRQQILVGRDYIEALRTYWVAHARFQQVMNGKLPSGAGASMVLAAAGTGSENNGDH